MKARPSLVAAALLAGLAMPAAADYDSHPELHPAVRCTGLEDPSSPTGYGPDCQPMIWDLDSATHLGERALAAPDDTLGFPNGRTDRPPPLYTDGVDGFEKSASGREPLCAPGEVPWWRPTGEVEVVETSLGPREAEWHEVACRRGSRATLGPWRMGSDPTRFDEVIFGVLEMANEDRLTADVAAGRTDPDDPAEWDVAAEVYTHHAAHHGFCEFKPDPCRGVENPDDPYSVDARACRRYRDSVEECPADAPRENGCQSGINLLRTMMARQGRLTLEVPDRRGIRTGANPLWECNLHVISDEPPAYGSSVRRNFRRQEGGSIGEAVVQMFTEAESTPVRPINVGSPLITHAATSVIPPFTMGVQAEPWYAPFDLALATMTMHSHESMVRGEVRILPASLPRSGGSEACGSSSSGAPNPVVYSNTSYVEPRVCEYWREPAGPVVVRKGQIIETRCIVNNGVTLTGAVGDPALQGGLENGPLGEVLYGEQPPSAYRVRYGCEEIPGVPPGLPLIPAVDCPPNPTVAALGEPIDGPYEAPEYCDPETVRSLATGEPVTGRCVPANQVFADKAEDAMCIPVFFYWPLDRLTNPDGSIDPEAQKRLLDGDVDEVGTPGRIPLHPLDTQASCDDGTGRGTCDEAGL